MKKNLLTLNIILFTVFVFACPTLANVAGQCSNCHTMHYSQNGTSDSYGDDGPYAILLINDCVGCHTTPTAAPTDPYANATPYVKSTTATGLNDSRCLAGGFFPHDTMGTGNNDDNHHGMRNTNDPAGMAVGAFYTQGTTGLGCAGINGCHGNETDLSDMEAIRGGHHKTSLTYRMLYVDTDPVEGDGADDYEKAIIANTLLVPAYGTNANAYCAGEATTDFATISALCAKCHGDFHGAGTTNSASEWIRHPTENVIDTTWAIGKASYTPTGVDVKENPPGYDNATYDVNEKRVTCLSCHRAHGTQTADLLRWAYTTQLAGQPAGSQTVYGCLGCHDAQR